MRILLVDDNPDSLRSLEVVLTDLGHEPQAVTRAEKALDAVAQRFYPLIITDIRMPGMDGLELLGRLKALPASKDSDVVIITGHGDMETAIDALRKGAYDYLNKPINARELAAVVDRSAERQALLRENKAWRSTFDERVEEATAEVRSDLERTRGLLREVVGVGKVVAASPAMARLVEETEIYHSDPTVPVLIEGETGSGKEIVARLVHYGKEVSDRPFVAINCSAIPAELFESEMFGHEPGAYTGSARRGAPGKLELAATGALFLDEISDLPLILQPKFLRVLEDRTFYRVGGLVKREFRARVICAANQDLAQLVDEGRFRRDLFHRLKVGHIRIPPLRERPEDIGPLAQRFLEREAQRKKKRFHGLSAEALALFESYDWPGNVRELENVVERAVLTSDAEILGPAHLGFFLEETGRRRPAGTVCATPGPTVSVGRGGMALPDSGLDLEAFTMAIIRQALDKFGGNKTRAAEYLGLSRYSLHRKLQKQA